MPIHRGEIFFACLGPVVGREINTKRRPVVVLSINDVNSKPLVVTIVPGTSWTAAKKIFQNEVRVDPSPTNGLSGPTLFQCHQVKAIDHSRLDQGPVGRVSSQELGRIEQAIGYCLGLPLKSPVAP